MIRAHVPSLSLRWQLLLLIMILAVVQNCYAFDNPIKPGAAEARRVPGKTQYKSLEEGLPPLVSVIAIIANPKAFHKREISFVAYVELGFEANILFLSPTDAKYAITSNAIWLGDPRLCQQSQGGKYVLVRGEFIADEGPRRLFAGTMNHLFSCDLWPVPSP